MLLREIKKTLKIGDMFENLLKHIFIVTEITDVSSLKKNLADPDSDLLYDVYCVDKMMYLTLTLRDLERNKITIL